MIDIENEERISKMTDVIKKIINNDLDILESEGITDDEELACIFGMVGQKYLALSMVESNKKEENEEEIEDV